MQEVYYNIQLFFCCIFIYTYSGYLFSQEDSIIKKEFKNAVYIEIGGSGILASVNYERILFKKNKFGFPFRMGITPYLFGDKYTLGNPIRLGVLFGKNRH